MMLTQRKVLWRCLGLMFAVLCLYAALPAWAQISEGGTPPSFQWASASAVPTTTMPAIDEAALLAEDEAEDASGIPHGQRFATALDVSLNLNNSGLWETLPNGDRVWRLRIASDGALSIHLIYDRWTLGKECKLWLYNDDHSYVIGAFTTTNNWDGTNITGPTPGEATTLEYVVPAAASDMGELSIAQVCHAYRRMFPTREALDSFGDANACQVNINCAEGTNWQDEKRGVAMIIDGIRWCSGSLINTSNNDFYPLFLTANHCLNGNQNNWLFIFNYESAACSPNTDGSLAQSVANATLLSTSGLAPGSDHALLRLASPVPLSYSPYFNGWNRTGVAPSGCRGISHPNGDVKKIARDNDGTVSDDWNNNGFANTHWNVLDWEVGGNEGGSSGSPLFNSAGYVVGQLTGGYEACASPDASWYGRFDKDCDNGMLSFVDPGGATTVMGGTYAFAPFYDTCTGFYIGAGANVMPFSHTSSTTYSNNDYGNECRTFPGPDNVYYWDAECTGTVNASLCGGSTWDTGLYVRIDDCVSGAQVACNDDFCGLQSEVNFSVTPGHRYFFFVDGFSAGSYGAYTLNISFLSAFGFAPPNDNCGGVESITSIPYTTQSSTCFAFSDYSGCAGTTSGDVVYRLNLPACTLVRATTCNAYTGYDTGLEVRTGGACPGSTTAACNDDDLSCSFSLRSTVTFVAVANQDYFILVHGFSNHRGIFQLDVNGAPYSPPNDECAGSTVIAALPYTDSGNTLCANASRPNCIGFGAPDVYYSYTSPICQNVTASLCGSGYDTRLEVRADGACPGDVQIGCNDDFCGRSSQLTFNAAEGVTYYIIVNGFVAHAGPYVLNVTGAAGAPAHDLCAGAKSVNTLPYQDIGSTTCATDQVQGVCYGGTGSNDVVYSYVHGGGNPCNNVLVSLCGSNYDTGLRVMTGGACPGTTEVGCSDDSYCGGSFTLQSNVIFTGVPGQQYWIHIDGYSSGRNGVYRLLVQPTCQPESLVVQRMGATNDVRLTWAPPRGADGGLLTYKIYRSTTFPVPIDAAHLIATQPFTSQYVDAGRVTNAALLSYYAVTVDVTPVLSDPGDQPGAMMPDEKLISPQEQAAMNAVFIPAYIDPANIEGPNPNKLEPDSQRR